MYWFLIIVIFGVGYYLDSKIGKIEARVQELEDSVKPPQDYDTY